MKRGFVFGFAMGSVLFFLLGLLWSNELIRAQYSLQALSGGSNVYASIGANLELGRDESAQRQLRLLAWVDRTNGQYANCMSNFRWYLFTKRSHESCKHFIEAPMPEDWQIPGLDKALSNYSLNREHTQ